MMSQLRINLFSLQWVSILFISDLKFIVFFICILHIDFEVTAKCLVVFCYPTSVSNPQISRCFKTRWQTFLQKVDYTDLCRIKCWNLKRSFNCMNRMYLCLIVAFSIWCYSLRKELVLDILQIRLLTIHRSNCPNSHKRSIVWLFWNNYIALKALSI